MHGLRIIGNATLVAAWALFGCATRQGSDGRSSGTGGSWGSSAGSGDESETSDGRSEESSGDESSSSTGAPGTSSSGSGSTTSSGTGGEMRWDVGAPPDPGDPGEDMGCDKVDFLFVIDSSPSMADEQMNLLTSFPGFIDAIQVTLGLTDFQLMVIDASLIPGAACDGVLGAGRVSSATGAQCNLVGGKRYATNAQPDLKAAFSCMGSRGTDGDANEQTMNSLIASIGTLNGAGQCNEGFIRPDALLVITIITDEEDSSTDIGNFDGTCRGADDDPNSVGQPADWYSSVVTIKNGDPNAVVVLSLIGDCDVGGTCPPIMLNLASPTAVTGAEPAPRIRQFTDTFPFGNLGPVCAPDYAPFFTQAVEIIDTACDGFVPPG